MRHKSETSRGKYFLPVYLEEADDTSSSHEKVKLLDPVLTAEKGRTRIRPVDRQERFLELLSERYVPYMAIKLDEKGRLVMRNLNRLKKEKSFTENNYNFFWTWVAKFLKGPKENDTHTSATLD